jgi:hypothetical protein
VTIMTRLRVAVAARPTTRAFDALGAHLERLMQAGEHGANVVPLRA